MKLTLPTPIDDVKVIDLSLHSCRDFKTGSVFRSRVNPNSYIIILGTGLSHEVMQIQNGNIFTFSDLGELCDSDNDDECTAVELTDLQLTITLK